MKTQWWARNSSRAMMIGAVAAVVSCSEVNSPPTVPLNDLRDLVVEMGYRSDMIVDHGEYFIVERDIMLRKSDLIRRAYGQANQWVEYGGVIVSQAEAASITVSLDSLDSGWQAAAESAMSYWSQTPGSRLNFTGVSGSADVRIVFRTLEWDDCTGDGTVHAVAPNPPAAGGQPGDIVVINANGANAGCYSAEQKRHLIQHELGHIIGFRHTNWQQREPGFPATQVASTPETDSESLMNGGIAVNGQFTVPTTNLSFYDNVATYTLWPEPLQLSVANVDGLAVVTLQGAKGALSADLQLETQHQELDDYGMQQYTDTFEPLTSWYYFGAPATFSNAEWTGYSVCGTPGSWSQPNERKLYWVAVHFPQGTRSTTVEAPIMNPGGWQVCYP
jgi:hypothetical protein